MLVGSKRQIKVKAAAYKPTVKLDLLKSEVDLLDQANLEETSLEWTSTKDVDAILGFVQVFELSRCIKDSLTLLTSLTYASKRDVSTVKRYVYLLENAPQNIKVIKFGALNGVEVFELFLVLPGLSGWDNEAFLHGVGVAVEKAESFPHCQRNDANQCPDAKIRHNLGNTPAAKKSKLQAETGVKAKKDKSISSTLSKELIKCFVKNLSIEIANFLRGGDSSGRSFIYVKSIGNKQTLCVEGIEPITYIDDRIRKVIAPEAFELLLVDVCKEFVPRVGNTKVLYLYILIVS